MQKTILKYQITKKANLSEKVGEQEGKRGVAKSTGDNTVSLWITIVSYFSQKSQILHSLRSVVKCVWLIHGIIWLFWWGPFMNV